MAEASTAASPSPFERRYSDRTFTSAPSALICTSRRTPAVFIAVMIFGSCACAASALAVRQPRVVIVKDADQIYHCILITHERAQL